MNKGRLFWHLIRFHFQAFPCYMFLLIGITTLMFTLSTWTYFPGSRIHYGVYHNDDQVFMFFYIFLLAAQLTWGIKFGKMGQANQNWATGFQEFLWSKAIDRSILFWAKLSIFSFLCALPLVPALVEVSKQPDVVIQLPASPKQLASKAEYYQKTYPNLRSIPAEGKGTNALILTGAGWDAFSYKALKTVLITLGILGIAMQARRWAKLWMVAFAGLMTLILLPIYLRIFFKNAFQNSKIPGDEDILFWTHLYGPWIWTLMLAVAVLVIWDSRRRFLTYPLFASKGKG